MRLRVALYNCLRRWIETLLASLEGGAWTWE